MTNENKHFYDFEDFRLDTDNPSLWRQNELVSIPPKALETLILLVEKKGQIVSREELLDRVWHETFVEEGNINYTISLLRKTLGNKEFIQTIPRRGYRFVAEIRDDSPQTIELENNSFVLPKKLNFRWILALVILVAVLFVSSFAFWWRKDSAQKENPTSKNAEATQAFIRGKMILESKNTDKRQEKAIDEFQKAISLDPTFAPAYVGLGEGFVGLAIRESYPNSQDYFAKARTAVEKALSLDANLAEGLMLRGWIKRNADWDFAGAEFDLRKGINLNPQNAMSHYRLAYILLSRNKKDEAWSEIMKASELDPISDFIQSGRFPILEARGEYDQALDLAQNFLNENKQNAGAQRAVATFLFHKQEFPKLIELAETALEKDSAKNNAFAWYSLVSTAYRRNGEAEKADEALKKLEVLAEKDSKALYSLAMNYAELNRVDEAISALQKCFEMREERMVWLNIEPRFANLKNDSRFQELLKKMKLA